MHTAPDFHPADHPEVSRVTPAPSRRVVDAPTRMFHWLFALSFLGAYLAADSERWRLLHVTLGYTLAGLFVFRVVYGLLGPRHAGLGALWRKLRGAAAGWRSTSSAPTLTGINGRQVQNLLMALAVALSLLLVMPLVLSGYGAYNDWGDWLEDVHGFFGDAFLAVVAGHIALIAGLSLLRRKNQALPMLTGRVDGNGPSLVKHNRMWLAVLLLAAVLAFGAWQWQQSPDGLVSARTWNGPLGGPSDGHEEDDD